MDGEVTTVECGKTTKAQGMATSSHHKDKCNEHSLSLSLTLWVAPSWWDSPHHPRGGSCKQKLRKRATEFSILDTEQKTFRKLTPPRTY